MGEFNHKLHVLSASVNKNTSFLSIINIVIIVTLKLERVAHVVVAVGFLSLSAWPFTIVYWCKYCPDVNIDLGLIIHNEMRGFPLN